MNKNKNTIPDELVSLITKRIDMLANIISSAEKDLKNPPEGSLRCCVSRHTYQAGLLQKSTRGTYLLPEPANVST